VENVHARDGSLVGSDAQITGEAVSSCPTPAKLRVNIRAVRAKRRNGYLRSAPAALEDLATLPGTAMQPHGYRYAPLASRFGKLKNAKLELWDRFRTTGKD
jgi:hypothetical protein